MLSLFKKIATYFTPLDEEAEVERAVTSTSTVITDDENKETPTKLEEDVNETPAAAVNNSIKEAPALDVTIMATTLDIPIQLRLQAAEPKDHATLDHIILVKVNFELTSIQRHSNQPPPPPLLLLLLPRISSQKNTKILSLGLSTYYHTHSIKAKLWWNDYDNGRPMVSQKQLAHDKTANTTVAPKKHGNNQSAKFENKKSVKNKPTPKKRNSNAPAKPTRQPAQSSRMKISPSASAPTAVKLELGKRTHQDPESEPPAKQKRLRSQPTPTSFKPGTTRGRAKKLGDHQCLVCGETFFDLNSRDEHAENEHPGVHAWKH
ncbi:unnamed protein product [Absidia cylindrospora]